MGWATQRGPRPRLVATPHRLASCVIVSGFRAALDLDTYPHRNLIRPQCAERAKPGRGKPVLIMHIGFLACFHAISHECSRFSKIATLCIPVPVRVLIMRMRKRQTFEERGRPGLKHHVRVDVG